MMTPDHLERQHTLTTATARYEDLRLQDSLADPEDGPLPSLPDSLELLALGELIARKAAYGRQLAVRSARRAGASWTQIGAALGTSKQSAWEAHNRWIEEQARRHGAVGELGFDAVETRAARELAGGPDAGEGG